MSAFIVHPEHINVLLWAGLQHVGRSGPLRWAFGNPTGIQELHPGNASRVGRMLLEENIASVNHLYNESTDVSADYTYRHPLQTGWSISELLNAVHCYQHQACEHPCWDRSEAHAFCDALQQRLIHRLPGYTDGPWGSVPSASPPPGAAADSQLEGRPSPRGVGRFRRLRAATLRAVRAWRPAAAIGP